MLKPPDQLSNLPLEKEVVLSSLEEIKTNHLLAMKDTGLKSSLNLCHEINFAITLALTQKTGINITPFEQIDFPAAQTAPPQITYIPYGKLEHRNRKKGWLNHSFSLILGFTNPIIVDGAYDQARKSRPFQISEIKSKHPDDYQLFLRKIKLIHYDIIKDDQNNKEIRALLADFDPQTVINALNALKTNQLITGEQYHQSISQFQLESKFGLAELFATRKRDWLQYFLQYQDIDYPSVQTVIDETFKQSNVPHPYRSSKSFHLSQLMTLGKKLISQK